MRRKRSRLTLLAMVVAISALGLVAFGIVALEGSVANAEAAAAQEARRASLAAVRELRARVANPAFTERLPPGECIVVTATQVLPPPALPPTRPDSPADFVTETTLEIARRLEFVERDAAKARERIEATLARDDRSEVDQAYLLAALLWVARRQGDDEAAKACRARLASCRSIPPLVAMRVLHFDAVEGRDVDGRIVRELLAAMETAGDHERIRVLVRGFDALGPARAHQARVLEEELGRVSRLRATLEHVRRQSGRLRGLDVVSVEGLVLAARPAPERVEAAAMAASSEADTEALPDAGDRLGSLVTLPVDAVLLWYPPARTRGSAFGRDDLGRAWVLGLDRFAEITQGIEGSDDVTTPIFDFRLELRAEAGLGKSGHEDAIPVFAGVQAVPRPRNVLTKEVPTRVLLVALAVLLMTGLWLLLRAFRNERAALAGRSDFLRSITHELRTPLASIRLFAETLASERANDEGQRHEFTQLLAAEAGRLSTLVENALELGRTERGERVWHFEETRLDELVLESVALFEPMARNASMTVVVDSVPTTLVIDRDAIRQVLWNLFDNALKYAPAGSRIDVCLARDCLARDRNLPVLRVRDYGPGIDAKDRDRVFDRFARGSDLGDGRIPGAGLGLAIVRSIVHAHGAQIRYEVPTSGSGACFVIAFATKTGVES